MYSREQTSSSQGRAAVAGSGMSKTASGLPASALQDRAAKVAGEGLARLEQAERMTANFRHAEQESRRLALVASRTANAVGLSDAAGKVLSDSVVVGVCFQVAGRQLRLCGLGGGFDRFAYLRLQYVGDAKINHVIVLIKAVFVWGFCFGFVVVWPAWA